MEALSVIAPLVLVLRGSTSTAVGSFSAPGTHPLIPSPVQKKSEALVRADSVVVTPFRPLKLASDPDSNLQRSEYRRPARRRTAGSSQTSKQCPEMILDYP